MNSIDNKKETTNSGCCCTPKIRKEVTPAKKAKPSCCGSSEQAPEGKNIIDKKESHDRPHT